MRKEKIKILCVEMYDLLAFFVLTIGIILFIRFFIFTPYTVIGESMLPTFQNKDWIIVEKFTKNFSTFERGDVIVFVPPEKKVPYIKRVIAFPGETVIVRNGAVYVCSSDNTTNSPIKSQEGLNCEQLQESYLPANTKTLATCGQDEFKVEGGLFAMGDHRGFSTDSLCCFGLQCYEGANYVVPDEYILGRVQMRLYPKYTSEF
ncbi:signal peptidase I [bacterium]|nr:signal peptidase I [bacterium]